MRPTRSSLAENPWLWVALFGGVGLLGVVLIGPKFAARWSRVERMQETRERVAIERAQQAAAEGTAVAKTEAPPVATATGSDDLSSLPEREPYVDADFQQPLPLRYLLVLMMVVMSVGTTGLLVTRGRERRAAEAAQALGSEPQQPPHA